MTARGKEAFDRAAVTFVDAGVPKAQCVLDEVAVVLFARDATHFHFERQDARNIVGSSVADVVEAGCSETEPALGDGDHHVLK